MQVKQISDNEILLIKYIKSVLWRVAKRLPCMQEARCLKVNITSSECRLSLQMVVRVTCVCWSTILFPM